MASVVLPHRPKKNNVSKPRQAANDVLSCFYLHQKDSVTVADRDREAERNRYRDNINKEAI
jgi:hypothetical protein